MLKDSLEPSERLRDNPLGLHLQALATSFREDGYADVTVRLKLGLLADFGRWFGRTRLAVTQVDERLVDAFVKHRQQVAGVSGKHSSSFSVISGSVPLSQIESRFVRYRPWLTF